MITVLSGENSFEIDRSLRELIADFGGTPERIDGVELDTKQLPDLLMGATLFAEKRLIIIRELSQNKTVWDVLPDWLGRVSDDIQLVLVEPKPDKRTRSYKALQKAATVRELKPWTERDVTVAEKWVHVQANDRKIKLKPGLARLIVERVGVDQWQLSQALDKLLVLGEVTEELISNVIEARASENVFDLFETALKGDAARVQEMVTTFALNDDPYQLFGLLSSQVFQLAALSVAHEGGDVAHDIGAHPFALSKLKSYAKERGLSGVKQIVEVFAVTDEAMKTSSIDPWLAIEQALLRVASK